MGQWRKLCGRMIFKDLKANLPKGTLPKVLDETGYAAQTPTTNGRFIAAVFATGELVCVDMKVHDLSKHLGVPRTIMVTHLHC